jgi:predicted O-methyltransferase YrrM
MGDKESWNHVQVGAVTAWNMEKAYSGIHWNASAGSRSLGVLLPAFIAAYDVDTCIEIGIANGFLTQLLARGLAANCGERGFLISCDINPNCCKAAEGMSEGLPISHTVYPLDSKSVNWLEALEGREAGLCAIDGDHRYETASVDIFECSRVVKEFGLLVIHDYAPGMPDVVLAVQNLLDTKCWQGLVIPEVKGGVSYGGIILQKKINWEIRDKERIDSITKGMSENQW